MTISRCFPELLEICHCHKYSNDRAPRSEWRTCNHQFTIQELLIALKSCKDTSPGPDNMTYGMIRHLDQDNLVKVFEIYILIWVSHIIQRSWHFAWIIPTPQQAGRLIVIALFISTYFIDFLPLIYDILSSTLMHRNLKYSLYADDCSIWHSSRNVQFSLGQVQAAFEPVDLWALQWGCKFSVPKCTGAVFNTRKRPQINLILHG